MVDIDSTLEQVPTFQLSRMMTSVHNPSERLKNPSVMEVNLRYVRRDQGHVPEAIDSRSVESLKRSRRYAIVAVGAMRNKDDK